MAMSVGMMGSVPGAASSSIGSWAGRGGGVLKGRRRAGRRGGEVRCAAASSLGDQYRTLRVQPGASETEIKRAYRKLALQYHPDVCKGNNCGVQFHRINEAYDTVLSSLRRTEEDQEQWQEQEWSEDGYSDEAMSGMYDPTWDLWEEWMGWEGAGIRDYSSHINPYI